MLFALADDDERIRPGRRGQRARCPCCRGQVIAKCGDVKIWHWAHLAADCDGWAEPETEWHLRWKTALAGDEYRGRVEVPVARDGALHRADVVLPNGVVVELQHSGITLDDVRAREAFYRRMIWIFDAREAIAAGRMRFLKDTGLHAMFDWARMPRAIRATRAPVVLDVGEGRLARVLEAPAGRAHGWCALAPAAVVLRDFSALPREG